jgi:hypothetical protein
MFKHSLKRAKYTTLGSKYNVPISPATTTSRKVYLNSTVTLTITTGTGTLSKNGGSYGASVSLVPGDYYQAKVTNSASYSTAVSITISNADTFSVTTLAEAFAALNPDLSEMLNPDASSAVNPA